MAEWTEVEADVMAGLERAKKAFETVENLEKKVGGQESLVGNFKTEIGDARKELASAMEAIKGNGEKSVDPPAPTGENTRVEPSGDGTQGEDWKPKSFDELKARLKEEGKFGQAKEAYDKMPQEARDALVNNPEELDRFYRTATIAPIKAPASLEDATQQANKDGANQFRKYFGLAEDEANFVPGSSNAAPSGFAGADSTTGKPASGSVARKLPGGVIPRPQGMIVEGARNVQS